MLPHGYPFRFADALHDGRIAVSLSADAHWGRDGRPYPGTLAVEILAQAAILLLPGIEGDAGEAEEDGEAMLAGIEGAEVLEPLTPGDRLWARVELDRRLGRLVKARGTLERESGEEVAHAGLLLTLAS